MKKKLTMLFTSLFLMLGTAWAQTRVLKLTDEQIGTTYPYALTDEDAAKVFGLTNLTIAVKVNTPASLSGRHALFCTSDPTQNANTSAKGKDSHYVAYGTSDATIGYLASCVTGDRFTKGGLTANANDVVLVYVINPSNKTCKLYINGEVKSSWVNAHTDGFMSGYEIATPKMVKEDYANAKIYIGGGVKADNAAFETFNGTITGVEVYSDILTDEQVKNVFPPVTGKVYQLKGKHDGTYVYADANNNGRLTPTATGNAGEYNQLWVLGKSTAEGKYTLRNAATKGYMTPAGEWYAKKDFADLYIIERTAAEGDKPTYYNFTGNANAAVSEKVFLHCWGKNPGVDLTLGKNWSGDGGGSQFAFVEVTSVTVASLAALAITDELNPLITEANDLKDNTILAGTTELAALSEALTTANGLTSSQDWDAVLAAVDALATAIANAEKYIEDNPVEEFEPTNLYALKSPTGTYLNFTPITTQGTTTQASFQNEPSFLYKIEENGSFAFQSFDDDDAYVGATDRWLVTKAKSLWNISAEDANGYVTISRSTDANARLGHDGNTNKGTGIFTNVGNTCFGWQLIPAYPITIIYKDSDDEVLETVKAATIAGTGYSFTVDTKGGTLVSCVADKGTMTETDGTYSFATVNGATTVTVTLEEPEEPEEPVVFNPTPGKAYALKVKGQELYLNIRTLGIDDPSTSGSNNISLSARPFSAIYFEAGGTEGTWKMKNVNGKYVGVPGKGWNPMICDTPHDWTIVLENGVVTIAKSAGAFVNANDGAVAAGNPLYCDKGTALQFELFDYDDVNFVTGTGTRNGDNGVGGQGTIKVSEIHEEGLDKIPLGAGWRLTMEVESNGASYNKWGSSILAVGSNAFPEKEGYKGFQLYLQSATNGGKLDAVFGGGDHIIDNVSYQDDFSLVVEYDGSSKITFTTVNELGNEATNVLSGSLPEIDVFSYGLPTGINIKSAAIQVFDIKYTFRVGTTPEGKDFSVTYNGEAVKANQIFYGNELDLGLFAATEIEGYTWAVVADKAANTLTLNYTQAEVADLQAVKDLVNRIGGAGTADKFLFVHTPWLNSKQETFILGAQDGKIRIEGSTLSAITTGLGWYLNNIAHINIAWNSLNEKTVSGAAYADLSNLPMPSQTETHTSDAKYRYYLNTCTFGYSMTSWTWKRWQQEIDWMALHGINMPLQLVGLEEVWRTFLIKCGYSPSDAKAFVAGPAFIAWWAMNNLQGWGGTAAGSKSGYNNLPGAGGVQDDAWYARQTKLAKQIVDAQRGLGMQPVLPGWSGMVPTNFAEKTGYTTRGNGGNWAGDFVRPLLLNVSNANYAKIAADYYECLEEVMGESQYYSMDPFHEGGGAGTMADYEALYAAMEAAQPGSQWVIQQWQWSPTQKYSLTAVPAGRLIVLDLFSDGSPAFDGYNGYAPQEAVFCAIPNFGGRSGLMGRLQNVTDNYFKFKNKYASIKGIGTAPEAIEQTPVTYDLIYQLPWMNGVKPDVAEWVNNYAVSRYGKDNAVVKEAWSLLRQGPLNYGADGIQGPVEDVWAARPNLDANKASSWGVTLANAGGTYTPARRQMLIDAVYKLIDQEDELELANGSVYESNYMYDLVEFGGAVMADYAYDLLLGIKAAKNAEGTNGATYKARRDAFLQLILDMDAFRGTNLNFRLGKWTQEARDAAGEVENATTATPDWYEYNNARTIVSTWSSPGTNLNDYSYRSWQGLLKDYYYKRWKYYFDNNCTNGEYKFFEWNWAHGKEHYVGQTGISNVDLTADQDGHTSKYTREPVGNTVEEAVKMLGKYIIPVVKADGEVYYAYRYLTNDLKGKVTVRAAAGGKVDFTKLFNIPNDAEVSGTVVKSDSPQANAVPVQDAVGDYTATITLADGTVLSNITVALVAMKDFEGVYTIALHHDNTSYDTYIANNGGRYELTAGQKVSPAVADKMFTIVPSSVGYTFSAQGQYLKTPKANSLTFSNSEDEMGDYIIEKLDDDNKYKLRTSNKYLKADEDFLFASSNRNDASTFTITKAVTFPFSVSAAGMATLCLPFNVVLPEGMVAYDLAESKITKSDDVAYAYMDVIAEKGDTLKKRTPVIVKAAEGEYDLAITMDDTNAKGALNGSLLRGNFVSQALTPSEPTAKLFIFANGEDGVGFYLLDTTKDATIGANKCWLEWNMPLGQVANSISLRFGDDTTDVEHIETSRPTQLVIYNILGQRLDAPQKGINIINGKKVLIK